jgi:hypothetical protein
MLIRVPHNESYPLTMLIIFTPGNEENVKLDNSHFAYDYKLPEGVSEDQVEVYSIYLGRDGLPAVGCGPVCLKRAVTPAVEPAPAVDAAPIVDAAPVVDVAPAVEPAPAQESNANDTIAPADAPAADAAVVPAADAPAADAPAVAADVPADAPVAVDAAPVSGTDADAPVVATPADAVVVTPEAAPAAPAHGHKHRRK